MLCSALDCCRGNIEDALQKMQVGAHPCELILQVPRSLLLPGLGQNLVAFGMCLHTQFFSSVSSSSSRATVKQFSCVRFQCCLFF